MFTRATWFWPILIYIGLWKVRLVRWLVWWSSNDDTVWYYSSFRHSTYTSAEFLQTNVSICYQSITAKVSFDGSIITIIMGINNPPPIHCAGKCIVNYLTSSDPHRGILSDILSGTPSDILSVILSDIYSHILSGILFFLAFYLAFILTFCLASFRHSDPGVPQHPGLAIWCLHSAERKGEWWQEEKQSGRWSCAFVTIWQVEKNQFTDHCPANDRDFPYEIMSSLSKMRWQSSLSNQTAHYLGSEQARTWFWSRPFLFQKLSTAWRRQEQVWRCFLHEMESGNSKRWQTQDMKSIEKDIIFLQTDWDQMHGHQHQWSSGLKLWHHNNEYPFG